MQGRVGSGVRYWRLRRGYSQAELAERSGVAVSVVRKLEQAGDHPDGPHGIRLATLYALARALNVQTAQLFPSAVPGPADQDPAQLALLPIRVALTPPLPARPSGGKEQPAPEPPLLQRALEQCTRLYDSDHYDQVAVQLPGLLIAVSAPGGVPLADREAFRIRSGVCQLAGWFLAQVAAHDLAYQAVRNALAYAWACDDPLATASCVLAECWLFIRQGRLLDAKRLAVATADSIEPGHLRNAGPEHLAVWGWLLLFAWAAAIRNNQEGEARELLRVAGSAGAASIPGKVRYNRYWSMLGLATVAMKEVEHEVIIGNYRKAIRLAERVPREQVMRADSRQRHLLDLAVAHAGIGNRPEASTILTGLRTTAPQWLRHQRIGRAVARKLIAAPGRTLTAEARALADFYDFGA
jgi:transcriptional regulator with XRE-family HTH domain